MLNIFEKGGPLMWPLLLCSVIALGIVFERCIFWVRLKKNVNNEDIEKIFEEMEKGNYSEALKIATQSRDYVAGILLSGLRHIRHGVSEVMEIKANEEINNMKSGMLILDTIITISPLLGILGTITGIIRCFNLLSAAVENDPALISIGISEALITTAAGLCIALPAIVFFNYFTGKVQNEGERLEKLLTRFEIISQKINKGESGL